MGKTDMTKALRNAALLRNLMETCLKAAPGPMTGRELADWPSIQEHTGTGLQGYSRLSTQLQNMVAKGTVEHIGKGVTSTYRWVGKAAAPKAAPAVVLPELKLRINKAHNTLTLQFAGLQITIEVAE